MYIYLFHLYMYQIHNHQLFCQEHEEQRTRCAEHLLLGSNWCFQLSAEFGVHSYKDPGHYRIIIDFLSGPTTSEDTPCVKISTVYRAVMSVCEVLNSGAITSLFVRVILSCVFDSNSERVAAQVGITSCLLNRLLSSAFNETYMIDLSADCVS